MSAFDRQPLSEVDTALIQTQSLESETQAYIEDNLEPAMREIVIPEIAALAAAANVPPGFSAGLDVVTVSRGTVKVINTWGTPEKPLALWFNDGTKDHGPKTALSLTWIDKTTGKRIYAKWVHGVPKTQVMEKGIEAAMPKVLDKLSREGKVAVSKKLGITA
jgi:hypothetical protein